MWDLSPTVWEEMGLSAALKYGLEEFGKHYNGQNLSVDFEEIDDLRVCLVGRTLENDSRKGGGTQITFAIPTDARRNEHESL